MIDTSTPRRSSGWLTICPKRPKPMMSAPPLRPSAISMPSSDGASRAGASRRASAIVSGVSAIEITTVGVRIAFSRASNMPTEAAAA